ncbi:MAG: alanine/glycine:cation symporter family protein [Fusobacteriaceae bacterium]
MNMVHEIVDFVNNILWGKNILVVLLVGSAFFCTFKTRFMQIRLIKQIFKTLFKSSDKKNGVSSFEAFCLGTASRVGAGNIAGVVAAISVGGPGALFWMWIVALLGSSTAFVECALAVIYRTKQKDGSYRGGTPWILQNRLNKRWLGIIYALVSIICYIGVIQVMSNSITESINGAYLVNKKYISYFLVIIIGFTIFGKKDKIISSLNKMIPIMSILYLGVISFILLKNITLIPNMITEIVSQAFGGKEFLGGIIGGAIMQGVKRGLFSNEAGSGNSGYASAIADNADPVKQGMLQVLGVFVDTLIICSASGFVVLLAKSSINSSFTGMVLFQESLKYHIGTIGIPFSVITIFLFSISTILGVTFFGKNALGFINDNKYLNIGYKILIILMVFFGGIEQNYSVWSLADFGLGIMTLINLYCILPLSNEAIEKLVEYEETLKIENKN